MYASGTAPTECYYGATQPAECAVDTTSDWMKISGSTPTTATTAYLVSNRDVNIGSIRSVHQSVAPPPLIPTPLSPLSSSVPYISQESSSVPYVSPQSGSISQLSRASTSACSPCVTQSPSQRPSVESQFWVAFIFGNVSRCQGCKGRIARGENKSLLPPPNDIVLGHKEHVVYQNARSGLFEQSAEKRNVYYHPWRTCVVPHFTHFNAAHHIYISPAVKHKLLPQLQSLT